MQRSDEATRLERVSLLAGIAVPILYYGNLLFSSLLYPGYSHVTQYASELGGPDARFPAVFNTGVVLIGIAGIASGLGFFLALRRLTGQRLLAALAGLSAGLFGVAMVMGGLFPMPDPRHGGYGLGLGLHLTPLFIVLALRKRRDLRTLSLFLVASLLVMIGLFAVMMGVGSLVTRANVGLFQRVYSLATFPWIGVASYALGRARPLSAVP
jgi:glucans biosynthesis protein C